MADGPRSEAKEKELGNPKLTLQVGGHVAKPVEDEGCAKEGAEEEKTLPSLGLDTEILGDGSSSSMGPEHPEQVSYT